MITDDMKYTSGTNAPRSGDRPSGRARYAVARLRNVAIAVPDAHELIQPKIAIQGRWLTIFDIRPKAAQTRHVERMVLVVLYLPP
jgi:hypothetical protein